MAEVQDRHTEAACDALGLDPKETWFALTASTVECCAQALADQEAEIADALGVAIIEDDDGTPWPEEWNRPVAEWVSSGRWRAK